MANTLDRRPPTFCRPICKCFCTGAPAQTKKGNPVESMIRFAKPEWGNDLFRKARVAPGICSSFPLIYNLVSVECLISKLNRLICRYWAMNSGSGLVGTTTDMRLLYHSLWWVPIGCTSHGTICQEDLAEPRRPSAGQRAGGAGQLQQRSWLVWVGLLFSYVGFGAIWLFSREPSNGPQEGWLVLLVG